MATELNLELLAGLDLTAPDGAGPNDLLVGVRADDEARSPPLWPPSTRRCRRRPADRPAGTSGPEAAAPPRRPRPRPRDARPRVVPGPYAFLEAMDALQAGLSVVVFSDNVPVEQEVRLKDEAASRDLLVMGPDCGTRRSAASASASPTSCGPVASAWSPRPAPGRSSSCACSTRPASA
jgi:FdrA protein